MRKKLVLSALILSLPFVLSACTIKETLMGLPVVGKFFGGQGGTSLGGPVTLSVWGLWENPEVVKTAVEKYKETHPNVNVVYEDQSILKATQYKETLFGRVGQQNVADVVLVHNTWVPELKGSLYPAPAKVFSEGDYSQRFYPVAKDSAVFDGKVYAVPTYYDGLVLVYNKKHFEEEGQVSPPTSWEEFRRLAFNLTKRDEKTGDILRAGAAIGTADNIEFFSDIVGVLFAQAGVSVPDQLDSRPARDSLAYYVLFSKADKTWDSTLPEASVAFIQEKVSMIFIPSWNLQELIKAKPDMQIGVAPLPQVLPNTPASWASFWMYAVPAVSPNKEAAWDFIKFLSQDDTQLLMFNSAATFRPYGAPFAAASLKDQVTSGPYGALLRPLLDTAGYSKSSSFASRSGNDKYVNALKDAVNEVLTANTSITDASEAALKKVKTAVTASAN